MRDDVRRRSAGVPGRPGRVTSPGGSALLAVLARETIAEPQPTKGGDVWARTVGRAEPVEDALRVALRWARERPCDETDEAPATSALWPRPAAGG